MDESIIIDELEGLAERFGVQIRYEPINLGEDSRYVAGGLCQLRGECLIIINSSSTMTERVRTLVKALRHFDLDQVYIRPAVRELLNKISDPSIMPNGTEEVHF